MARITATGYPHHVTQRTAIRYVENNPVRAGLVQEPDEYPWSSAKSHVDKGEDIICKASYLQQDIKNWLP